MRDMNEVNWITAKVKVTKVGESDIIGDGKKKQEITVGDKSGNARVTLWKSDIEKPGLSLCYQLNCLCCPGIHGEEASVLTTKW